MTVDCETCREALSARLDGEAEPAPAGDVDAHVAGCAACRAWQGDAAALTRSLRLRPAEATPDLLDAVLGAAAAQGAPGTPGGAVSDEAVPGGAGEPGGPADGAAARGGTGPGSTRGWYPRAALAGVAVAQITLGLAQVLGTGSGADGHGAHGVVGGSHLFNESTAWNLALGLGLLWTALRPRATTGMLPVLSGFVVVLGAFSAQDLAAGQATVQRVTSHAILVLGLLLLVVVHRGRRDPRGDRAADPLPEAPDSGGTGSAAPAPEQDPAPATRPRLRPVSRRRAA